MRKRELINKCVRLCKVTSQLGCMKFESRKRILMFQTFKVRIIIKFQLQRCL